VPASAYSPCFGLDPGFASAWFCLGPVIAAVLFV
jgi:hypothetical protein